MLINPLKSSCLVSGPPSAILLRNLKAFQIRYLRCQYLRTASLPPVVFALLLAAAAGVLVPVLVFVSLGIVSVVFVSLAVPRPGPVPLPFSELNGDVNGLNHDRPTRR